MTTKKPAAKSRRNPPDLTLRNLRAEQKRNAQIVSALTDCQALVGDLARRVAMLESHMSTLARDRSVPARRWPFGW
jgi:hypothetical protein